MSENVLVLMLAVTFDMIPVSMLDPSRHLMRLCDSCSYMNTTHTTSTAAGGSVKLSGRAAAAAATVTAVVVAKGAQLLEIDSLCRAAAVGEVDA